MIPDSMKPIVRAYTGGHEGKKLLPYIDSLGNISIGIGYNLSARGLPDTWIENQFQEDADFFYDQLMKDFSWFNNLCIARKVVLIDMCFMGYKKFLEFHKMLCALSDGDYKSAAAEMINSEWYKEVHSRGDEDARIMLSGEI